MAITEPTLKSVTSSPVRQRVSEDEWEMRCDLAAAYQLAALFQWTDLIYTHFSARVPGTEHLLINPFGLMFDEVVASNLVKIDKDGNVIDDPTGLGINYAGFVIHGCVHEARPEINCVLHTHTRPGIAVSAQERGLLPLSQHSLRVYGMITYHDYEGIARDLDERARLTADLGASSRAMILRNHGLLTLGRTVCEAVELMYYLDRACQIQVDALAGGHADVRLISEQAAQKSFRQFERPDSLDAEREWPALLRLLDRRGIPYRQ
jgi:ribulose-5-phosphate 4-epimerase/fuculose-1-phosphate aldolase